jgi:hypothetical protein
LVFFVFDYFVPHAQVSWRDMHFSRFDKSQGMRPRLYPLIAGPTGAGKSFLVREVANRLKAHYLPITYGNWMPQGTKEGQYTLFAVLDALATHPWVVLHIDELDKGVDYNTTWARSVANDLWNVLDLRLPLRDWSRDNKNAPKSMSAFEHDIQHRLWIVGSGTWQMVFEAKRPSKLGFARQSGSDAEPTTASLIQGSRAIPTELTARFHSEILILRYPTDPAEIQGMLDSHGITALAKAEGYPIDPSTIHFEEHGMRVLESIKGDLLLRKFKRESQFNSLFEDNRQTCLMELGLDAVRGLDDPQLDVLVTSRPAMPSSAFPQDGAHSKTAAQANKVSDAQTDDFVNFFGECHQTEQDADRRLSPDDSLPELETREAPPSWAWFWDLDIDTFLFEQAQIVSPSTFWEQASANLIASIDPAQPDKPEALLRGWQVARMELQLDALQWLMGQLGLEACTKADECLMDAAEAQLMKGIMENRDFECTLRTILDHIQSGTREVLERSENGDRFVRTWFQRLRLFLHVFKEGMEASARPPRHPSAGQST